MESRYFLPIPRTIWWTVGIVVAVTIASFVGYLWGTFQLVLFWVLLFTLALIGWRRLEWAAAILFAELIIGGKGYLFSVTLFNFSVSWRIAAFGVVCLLWLITRWRDRRWRFWQQRIRWPLVAFVAALSWGAVNGFIHHDPKVVFFDVNGYLYFGLFVIAFDCIRNQIQQQRLLSVVLGASIATAFLTIAIFSYFTFFQSGTSFTQATHLSAEQLAQLGQTPESAQLGQTLNSISTDHTVRLDDLARHQDIIYRWLRDDGIGEVSYLGNSFFRVFFYSHIWLVFALIYCLAKLMVAYQQLTKQRRLWYGALVVVLTAVLLVSFSRSLLLGLVASTIVVIFFLPRYLRTRFFVSAFIALAVLVAATAVGAPHFINVVLERVGGAFQPSQEIATQTRSQLLQPLWQHIQQHPIIGSGFGTTVVIPTFIPGSDIVRYISVYLFEWTYLDLWVKLGFVGLAALGWLVLSIWQAIRQYVYFFEIKVWLIASLVGFLIINIATPYLNHPLGIGWLVFTALLASGSMKHDEETR